MVKINMSIEQIRKVIKQLSIKEKVRLIRNMPLPDKVRLVKELEKETWVKQINEIINNIDRRRKKLKISKKEIFDEVEKARQEFYEDRR